MGANYEIHREPATDLTSAYAARTTDRGAGARTGEREGKHMTMKEKIRIHAEIERENKRKLKEWKEGKAA